MIKILIKIIARYYLKKPEVTELLAIKYPTWPSVWDGFANEICYLLGLKHSYKLTSVNIEVTNRCNLSCTICPVPHEMSREKEDISDSLFKKVIDENRDLHFILPFQWGEPLLHKSFFDLVQYAKNAGIPVMATTNATLLNEKMARKLINSKIDRITFSVDGDKASYERIRQVSFDTVRKNIKRFKELRDELHSPIKIDISMVACEGTLSKYNSYLREWEGFADRVQVVPVMKKGKRKNKCRELYRGSLVVFSNGKVVPCCVDFDGALEIGNVRTSTLKELFNNKKMQELRKLHSEKKFPPICAACDEIETDFVSKRFS